jgi:histidyl-tRNA synthetase
MKALENYLFRVNSWARLTKGKLLTLDTAEDRQKIAQKIESDLSPENLHMDGEASMQHVRTMLKLLKQARKELIALDPSVKFYEDMY